MLHSKFLIIVKRHLLYALMMIFELCFRPLSWIQSQKMGAFLGVTRGSTEVPWLLEMRLNFPEVEELKEEKERDKPIVLVGKGTYTPHYQSGLGKDGVLYYNSCS